MAVVVSCVVAIAAAPGSGHAASEGWLARINQIRTASGLSPVGANSGWVTGLDDHLTYLEQTPSSYMTGQYASAHTENPASPYYTSAGANEAASSDLAFGTGSDLGAINSWLTAPFHAIGMLRPALTQVAFARHNGSGDAGLDVINGLTGSPASSPVLFPGNGSTIDLTRYGGESPSPIETCTTDHPGADYSNPGLGLIAMLPQAPTNDLSATLEQPDHTTISSNGNDLCVVDENNYTSSDSVYGPTGKEILQGDHAVLIFPRRPLVSGSYTVHITQGGQPDIAWSFRSGQSAPVAKHSDPRAAIAKPHFNSGHVAVTLNNSRSNVKVKFVVLDSVKRAHKYAVPAGDRRTVKAPIKRHGRTRVKVTVNGNVLTKKTFHHK
jgi:hypothetical protein